MDAEVTGTRWEWLCAGREAFPAMLAAIDAAGQSVGLETYIYSAGALGERFRGALIRARQRGVAVRVLVDALGSMGLPWSFWRPLLEAGGEVRQFNPLSLNHLGIRNHRKLLVCDQQVAFVGGFNIAPQYDGDGVTSGWFDVGLKVEGPLAGELDTAFSEMFDRADFQHKRFVRFRRSSAKKTVQASKEQLLLSGPGRGRSPIKRALWRDLAQASRVEIVMVYFFPRGGFGGSLRGWRVVEAGCD